MTSCKFRHFLTPLPPLSCTFAPCLMFLCHNMTYPPPPLCMTSFMNDHLNLGLETSSESSYLVSETIPFLVQAHSGFKLKDKKWNYDSNTRHPIITHIWLLNFYQLVVRSRPNIKVFEYFKMINANAQQNLANIFEIIQICYSTVTC